MTVPRSFPALLKAATPRLVATPAFAGVSLTVFAAMLGSGVSPFFGESEVGMAWGAMFGPSVILDGEAWRLLSCMFLHFGVVHLAFNMWFLLRFGPLVERLYGAWGFAALYLLSGLGGSIASLRYHPMVVAAGASGALFGIVGALVAYLVARRDVPPRAILQLFSPGLRIYLGVDSLLGLLVPQIDGAAHLGGLAAGFACGLVLARPWPPPPTAHARGRRLATAGGLSLGLGALFVALIPGIRDRVEHDPAVIAYRGEQQALDRYNAFLATIRVGIEQYDEIAYQLDVVRRQMGGDGARRDAVVGELDRLISRAGANEQRLRAAVVESPELRVALGHLASCQAHLHLALKSLRGYVESEDEVQLEGADGYDAHIRSCDADMKSFKDACDGYLKAHTRPPDTP